ncbi:hypothetical protein bAD24_I11560 [Burkholderia sp. AD24]|nr:hypothetical protein bAD24_I11560 [Burkholderia sp. AD24]
MSDAIAVLQCARPDCTVAKSGVCMEGHEPLESCNAFGKLSLALPGEDDEQFSSRDDEHASTFPVSEGVRLPHGEALHPDDVAAMLRARPARFISIIGPRRSGKTTLICSLYDQFLKGTCADFSFVGSQTLLAFERRCHYSRAVSGAEVPDTARTSISDGLRFLHLGLKKQTTGRRLDFVFSDRAGETYSNVLNSVTAAKDLPEIEFADAIVLLLDGRRVCNATERTPALMETRQLLRGLIDGKALGKTSVVQVVVTMYDLIVQSAEQTFLLGELEKFKGILFKSFAESVGALSWHVVAARPEMSGAASDFGVEELLSLWGEDFKAADPRKPLMLTASSEFDMFMARIPEALLL